MPILLVRHGDALASKDGDESRVLSLRGRDETRAVGRALLDRGLLPVRMISSPLVRAVQTAELLAGVLGHTGIVEAEPALIPDGDAWRSESMLRDAVANDPAVLIIAVTHEPIVRAIAAQLLGQSTYPPFRTSGCVLIDGGRATLRLDPSTI